MSYMSIPVTDGLAPVSPFVNQDLGTKTIDNTGVVNPMALSKKETDLILPILLVGILLIVIFE